MREMLCVFFFFQNVRRPEKKNEKHINKSISETNAKREKSAIDSHFGRQV